MSHLCVEEGRFTGVLESEGLALVGMRRRRQQRRPLVIYPDAATHALFALYFERMHLVQDVVPRYAASQEEGLRLLRREAFDLVLLSTESRWQSLESVVQGVTAASQRPSVALIGICFPDLGKDREQHLRAGFTDFLAAPPSFETFARIVGARLAALQDNA